MINCLLEQCYWEQCFHDSAEKQCFNINLPIYADVSIPNCMGEYFMKLCDDKSCDLIIIFLCLSKKE